MSLLHTLRNVSPFHLLNDSEHACLQQHSSLIYLDKRQQLHIHSQPREAQSLLVIFKGKGQWQDDQQHTDIIHANESVGALVLLQGGSGTFTALEEVLAHQISADCFQQLCQQNQRFFAHWHATIQSKRAALQQQEHHSQFANFMMLTAQDVTLLPYLHLEDSHDLRYASAQLRAHHTTAALVTQANQQWAILTTTDLLNALTDYDAAHYPKLSDIANPNLISIAHDAHLFRALVLMTEHHLSHIVVTQDQQPIGFLHQKTLLGALANQSFMLGKQLEQAQQLHELKPVQYQLNAMIRSLHDKGIKARLIAELVSSLNRTLLKKVCQLCQPKALAQLDYAFIVLGSEGRQEQLLRTDQDNALLWQGEADLALIQQWAEAIHTALSELGFPDCPGHIMITNPLWRQPLNQFIEQVQLWTYHPSQESMMYLSILLDADTISGNTQITQTLIQAARRAIMNSHGFLGHFAKSALEFDTPLGFFSQLKTESGYLIDIKKGGLFPIIHGARVMACELDIPHNNTYERLQSLGNTRLLSRHFADELIEAFDFMQQLRLHQQLTALEQEQPINNQIDISILSPLQIDLLKDCLKLVNRFKEQLHHHYKLHQYL